MCGPTIIKESDDCDIINEPKSYEVTTTTIEITTATSHSDNLLCIPSTTIATSNSLDTLTESTMSGPSSPSNLSSVTLVGSTGSGSFERTDSITTESASTTLITTTTTTTITSATSESKQYKFGTAPTAPLPERIRPKVTAGKESDSSKNIITPSLPPTVTTTHYVETGGGSTATQESQTKVVDIDEPRPKSSRSSSTVSTLQPHKTLMDRRPSAGANIQIPHAALCQHRHSLQLNGDSGLPRVRTPFFVWFSSNRFWKKIYFLHFREVVNVPVHDHSTVFRRHPKRCENIYSERRKKNHPGMMMKTVCFELKQQKKMLTVSVCGSILQTVFRK